METEINSMMKKSILLLLVTGLVIGMAFSSFAADSTKPLIIDVRTESEWNEGHLEGAILLPVEVVGKEIGTVAKDKSMRLYVYCRSGRRSQIAKETLLEKLGYKDVVNLGSVEDATKKMGVKIIK